MAKKKNAPTEQQMFEAALGRMCPNLSDSMVRKCWKEIADHEDEVRTIMIDAMLSFAYYLSEKKKGRR